MTDLPRIEQWHPLDDAQQVSLSDKIAELRAAHAASQAAREPERRAAIATGPSLRDIDAAVDCSCSCHPRPADAVLHEGGVSCPCQLTPAERAESMEELLGLLSEASEAQFTGEKDIRRRAEEAASRLQIELREIGGAAPFVIRGLVDGRGFYLRERHDLWSVVIAPDDDPTGDPWVLDRSIPVIVVASGESSALERDGVFDAVRALEVAVDAVRTFLLRRICTHDGAGRFCPTCGVDVAHAAAWHIEARRDV